VSHLAAYGVKTRDGKEWDLNRVRRCARAEAALVLKEQYGLELTPTTVKDFQKAK
jgi:hypothetical protein